MALCQLEAFITLNIMLDKFNLSRCCDDQLQTSSDITYLLINLSY